jgi:hypothetical protein
VDPEVGGSSPPSCTIFINHELVAENEAGVFHVIQNIITFDFRQ